MAEKSIVWRLGRDVLDDALHLGQKAHVQEPVGLVQNQYLDVGQVHGPLLQMVEQAAWRGDDDVHAAPEPHDLGGHARAAVDGDAAQAGALAVQGELGLDLDGEFAGRNQHEGARMQRSRLERDG